MTDDQKKLVRDSYAKIRADAPAVAAIFYQRLFEIGPDLRPLFKGDMAEQGRKLMTMITTAVDSLDRIDAIVPAVQQLGRRHAAYGVKLADYDTVGAALLWTLEHGLGDDFTPPVRDAWTACYTTLAGVMKAAASAAA